MTIKQFRIPKLQIQKAEQAGNLPDLISQKMLDNDFKFDQNGFGVGLVECAVCDETGDFIYRQDLNGKSGNDTE